MISNDLTPRLQLPKQLRLKAITAAVRFTLRLRGFTQPKKYI